MSAHTAQRRQKVLVTGATGRVGSRLAPRLLERGHSVRVLLRRAEQAESFQKPGLEVVVGDEARQRTLDDPWEGIVDTTRIRQELGFRAIYPSVFAAQDAGAL